MSREMVVDDVASNYDRRLRVWPKVIGKNEGLVWAGRYSQGRKIFGTVLRDMYVRTANARE